MIVNQTTKIYKNTGKQTLDVLGLGELKPGDQVSVTTDYHTPIRVDQYPGLVEVVEEEQKNEEK